MSLQTLLIVYTKVSFCHYLNGFLLFDQDLDVGAWGSPISFWTASQGWTLQKLLKIQVLVNTVHSVCTPKLANSNWKLQCWEIKPGTETFATPSKNLKKIPNLPWEFNFKVLLILQIQCYWLVYVYKANHKVCQKKVSRKDLNNFIQLQIEFSKFRFSARKFSIRVSRLGHAWIMFTIILFISNRFNIYILKYVSKIYSLNFEIVAVTRPCIIFFSFRERLKLKFFSSFYLELQKFRFQVLFLMSR